MAACTLSRVDEALALLTILLSDSNDNQLQAAQAGIIPVLIQYISSKDAEVAWLAADVVAHMGDAYSAALVSAGAVEVLCGLLKDSVDAVCIASASSGGASHTAPGGGKHSNRVQPMGNRRLEYSTGTGSTCLHSTHDASTTCDYCLPSVALTALLRLTGAAGAPGVLPRGTISPRESSGGGCLSEVRGNVPASLETMSFGSGNLDAPKLSKGGAGDVLPSVDAASVPARVIQSGGLEPVLQLLQRLIDGGCQPSKLMSAIVSLLEFVLGSGAVPWDAAWRSGAFIMLCDLLTNIVRPGVMDVFQLRSNVCTALRSLLQGCPANQQLAREKKLLTTLLSILQEAVDRAEEETLDDIEQVTVACLDTLAACARFNKESQDLLVDNGILRHTYALSMRPQASFDMTAASLRLLGTLSEWTEAARLALMGTGVIQRGITAAERGTNIGPQKVAESVAVAIQELLRADPSMRPRVLATGAMGLLVRMLRLYPPTWHNKVAADALQCIVQGDVSMQNDLTQQVAADALPYIVQGDVSMQNDLTRQGCLQVILDLIRGPDYLVVSATHLFISLAYTNSFVKNVARQEGFIPVLLDIMKTCGTKEQGPTVAAVWALAELCRSNHGNQAAVAENGGIELLLRLLTELLTNLPADGWADGRNGVSHPHGPSADGIVELEYASRSHIMLEALLRLQATLVEFNDANKKPFRESSALSLLAHFVLSAAKVPDLSVLTSLRLLPALAAALGMMAGLSQDCAEVQHFFIQQSEDVAPALFRLLSVDGAPALFRLLSVDGTPALFFLLSSNLLSVNAPCLPRFLSVRAPLPKFSISLFSPAGTLSSTGQDQEPPLAAYVGRTHWNSVALSGGACPSSAADMRTMAKTAANSSWMLSSGLVLGSSSSALACKLYFTPHHHEVSGSSLGFQTANAATVREAANVLEAVVAAAKDCIAAALVLPPAITSAMELRPTYQVANSAAVADSKKKVVQKNVYVKWDEEPAAYKSSAEERVSGNGSKGYLNPKARFLPVMTPAEGAGTAGGELQEKKSSEFANSGRTLSGLESSSRPTLSKGDHSDHEEILDHWRRLVGRAAPFFQNVSSSMSDTTDWRAVNMRLA
eukprot:gene28944-32136_t